MGAAPTVSQTRLGPAESVDEMLRSRCAENPDKVMFRSIEQGSAITYRQMLDVTAQLGRLFDDLGLRANDRVAVLGENSLEFLIIALAAMRYGATFCPLNPEYLDGEIEKLLARARPKATFCHRSQAGREIGGAHGQLFYYEDWRSAAQAEARPAADPDLFAAIAKYPVDRPPVPVSTGDSAGLIFHTSGTEGEPKGIVHSSRGFLTNAQNAVAIFEIGPQDVLLEYRPYSWAAPFCFGCLTLLFSGATVVFAKKFSRSRFFDWIRDYRVTVVGGIPAVFNALLSAGERVKRSDIPWLRFITSSTAPLPASQQKRFVETYDIPIVTLYGATEGGWMAFTPPSSPRIGSVGKPAACAEMRIVDEAGKALPAGTVGEIEVGGVQRAIGYLLPDGSVQPYSSGRIRIGDLGVIDADGYLYITGRKKDLIIRGGENVAPAEIDNVLLSHPDIADGAALGVPDPIYGEEVVCFVVPKEGRALGKDEVLRYCSERLAKFKVPRDVFFADSIPKGEHGKVRRREMLEIWHGLKSGGKAAAQR
ncbi:MAG TPA: class I adenylate-forming enzyme family protein [Anaerolineae bacterium]|nr:MAG: hypothetical protein A3G83_16560 [Betaproteobacteria bacterium RIFCSPLOWO2_12_FULL_68_20]HKZ85985.1 class I adenylate-forming enzyme family protein [Anaerolineae bacterium]